MNKKRGDRNDFLAYPYIGYLALSWRYAGMDLDPEYVLISGMTLPIQEKINLTLTAAIAFDRLQVRRSCISKSPGELRFYAW